MGPAAGAGGGHGYAQAPPDYRAVATIRWLSVPPGVEPLALYQPAPITLSAGNPFFYHGLGRDEPGLWRPGFYRVELRDAGGQVVVFDEFEVRR